jgi:integrase
MFGLMVDRCYPQPPLRGTLRTPQWPTFLPEGASIGVQAGWRYRSTFHDFRHTCASLLFQWNAHPTFVQELLGHASVAITPDTYSHMLPGMGGEAADAIGVALG